MVQITADDFSRILELARTNPEASCEDDLLLKQLETLIPQRDYPSYMHLDDVSVFDAASVWSVEDIRNNLLHTEQYAYILRALTEEEIQTLIQNVYDAMDWDYLEEHLDSTGNEMIVSRTSEVIQKMFPGLSS